MTDINKLYHEHIVGGEICDNFVLPPEDSENYGDPECTTCSNTAGQHYLPAYDEDPAVILGAIKKYGIRIEPEIVMGNDLTQQFVINGIRATQDTFNRSVMRAVLKLKGVAIND